MLLPALDTVPYQVLRDELVASIPRYSTNWTDFNASDPGITILELLSWVSETLLYRIDELTEASYLNFLRLVAGAAADEVEALRAVLLAQRIDTDAPQGVPLYVDPEYIAVLDFLVLVQHGYRPSIQETQLQMVRFWSIPFRAVTHADFELLALQATAPVPDPAQKVARAVVYEADDGVTVVVVSGAEPVYTRTDPDTPADPIVVVRQPDPAAEAMEAVLVSEVTLFLAPRRLAGSLVSVEPPVYTPVYLHVVLVPEPAASPKTVANEAILRLETFLDPLHGGWEGTGWPYDRPLSVNDLATVLERVPGVRYVQTLDVSTGQFQVAVFSTVGVDTWIGQPPELGTYPVRGLTRLERLELRLAPR